MSTSESDSLSASHQQVTEVLSLLRHELRTPVNGILGYSEIILDDLEGDEFLSSNQTVINALSSLQICGQKILTSVNNHLVLSTELVNNFESDFITVINLLTHDIVPIIDNIFEDCETLHHEEQLKASGTDIDKIESSTKNLKKIINLISQIKIASAEDILCIFRGESNRIENVQDKNPHDRLKSDSEQKFGVILVVDDVENNRVLFSRQLQRQGYEVDTAVDGYQALEKLSHRAYDLILLDYMMPELNGFQVLSRLKSDQKLRHIPVIMISANDEIDQVIRCIEIGAEDYLPKPLNSTLLRARITSTLDKKQLRDREQDYLRQVESLSAKMTKELEMGRQMQLNFLPRELVQHPSWQFSAFFKPARQVAGDFYDLFELTENRVGIVIADVCDKGVGAALFMALFRSLIRIFSFQIQIDYKATCSQGSDSFNDLQILKSEQILEAIALTNDYVAIHHGDLSMFATLFYGILDLNTGQLSYINGGHESLVVITSDGKIREQLKATGPAVGMMPKITFKMANTQIERGEILVGYTDGVSEARNLDGEFFSRDELYRIIQQPADSGADLLETIKVNVLKHIDTAEQFDDITLLAIHRRESLSSS
ncbi:SpoIIE family protein phosphatase [Synechococcus sp. PCC 6312]|uniref:SpoIIE family protein phosphatase n=1 Tax=Synechococcus sp. (strain ATCC 27167 / PCC 6312) TaxID=195253 RepID=UPI00029ECBE7|nr:SpoIIE family protein phosphatase [Synechococcus sp. PCC 6312]AFY61741.1 serine phosphatase RsbU, regulator of sigma subunit [Synechococcus sp. PCC 6312]